MKKSQHIKKTISQLLRRRTMTHLSFMLVGLLFTCISALAQRTVTGKVTNQQNVPVVGASVVVKGTTTGTTTNQTGDFTIMAARNAVLVISDVNYIEQEITLGDNTSLTVLLVLKSGNLDEVVVVGYGTQRRRDITGAITKVNADKLMNIASANAIDQLKGQAAGVTITSTSAVPGGGSQIRIRGNRTMVANTPNSQLPSGTGAGPQQAQEAATADQADAPLLVVDGIPYSGNLNDISPNDIASLEILKDASATAIYGSRGAGGVILVTTKRGTSGKVRFSYDAYYGFTKIMDKLDVYDAIGYNQLKLDAAEGHSTSPGSQPWPNSIAENAALAAGVSTDWQDLIYESGMIMNHNITISGGSDKSRYSMSLGYFQQEGIIPNQSFERFSIRSTMDHQLSRRIRIGLTTINSLSYQNTPGGSGVTQGLMRITPMASTHNPDGTLNLQILTGNTDNLINPLTLINNKEAILARNRRLRTFNSFYGEVDIISGLKYRINIGLDYYSDKGDGYSGPGTYVNSSLVQSQSTASIRNNEFWQYTIENLLIYEKTIATKHRIGATALYSVQKSHNQGSLINAIGVPFDFIQNTNFYQAASVNAPQNGNFIWQRGLLSFMGRATYTYNNKYSLTATVRSDGSSVLSPGNQWYTYPAFSLAWNVKDEDFMNDVSWLTALKLRAGWGVAASQGINPYSSLGLLGTSAYNFGQSTAGLQGGYTIASLPNKSLKWQSTSQFNFGLDFGLFNNRLFGSIEIYNQKTKDILLPVSLPPSNGGGTSVLNLGKTKGNGFELTLSSVNVKNRDFGWTSDFNYFFNREEIVELTNPTQTMDIGNGWFVGHPITVIYDFKKLGIWQTGDHGLTTQLSPIQKPGDIRLQDLNNDNRITADDRQVIGNFQPTFEAGLGNTIRYKSFDLQFTIYAKIGHEVVVPYLSTEPGGSFFAGYNWFLTGRNNQLKVDYWTPRNPTNKFPQPDALAPPQYNSVLSYVDGSFVKVRNINLGYQLPTKILERAGLGGVRIYVSAINPFVIWSPFVKEGYGPDPEGNGFGGGVAVQGIGQAGTVGRQITVNANNPATRQFIVGLNLNF